MKRSVRRHQQRVAKARRVRILLPGTGRWADNSPGSALRGGLRFARSEPLVVRKTEVERAVSQSVDRSTTQHAPGSDAIRRFGAQTVSIGSGGPLRAL